MTENQSNKKQTANDESIEIKSKNFHYAFNTEYLQALLEEKNAKDLNKALIKKAKDKAIVEQLFTFGKNKVKFLKEKQNAEVLYFEVQYPGLLVGLGYTHEIPRTTPGLNADIVEGQLQLGFSFDYVTGAPYIPGSTIKGIIRNVFDLALEKKTTAKIYLESKNSEINWDNLKEIINTHFGQKHDKESESECSGKDIFYDAYIVGTTSNQDYSLLGVENIAPHTEGATKNPKPISFLKIMPKTAIAVCMKTDKDYAEIYAKILEDMGIGAKTNVGFGVIQPTEESKICFKVENSLTTASINPLATGSGTKKTNNQDHKKDNGNTQNSKKIMNAGENQLKSETEGIKCPNCSKWNYRYYENSKEERKNWKSNICFMCKQQLRNNSDS